MRVYWFSFIVSIIVLMNCYNGDSFRWGILTTLTTSSTTVFISTSTSSTSTTSTSSTSTSLTTSTSSTTTNTATTTTLTTITTLTTVTTATITTTTNTVTSTTTTQTTVTTRTTTTQTTVTSVTTRTTTTRTTTSTTVPTTTTTVFCPMSVPAGQKLIYFRHQNDGDWTCLPSAGPWPVTLTLGAYTFNRYGASSCSWYYGYVPEALTQLPLPSSCMGEQPRLYPKTNYDTQYILENPRSGLGPWIGSHTWFTVPFAPEEIWNRVDCVCQENITYGTPTQTINFYEGGSSTVYGGPVNTGAGPAVSSDANEAWQQNTALWTQMNFDANGNRDISAFSWTPTTKGRVCIRARRTTAGKMYLGIDTQYSVASASERPLALMNLTTSYQEFCFPLREFGDLQDNLPTYSGPPEKGFVTVLGGSLDNQFPTHLVNFRAFVVIQSDQYGVVNPNLATAGADSSFTYVDYIRIHRYN